MRVRKIGFIVLFLTLVIGLRDETFGQGSLKRVRIGFPATNIGYLPFFVADHNGFYQKEGIDLQLILLRGVLASTAILTGEIDYSAAVTGVIASAVHGRPMKVLMFTSDRPLFFLVTRKEIREPQALIG